MLSGKGIQVLDAQRVCLQLPVLFCYFYGILLVNSGNWGTKPIVATILDAEVGNGLKDLIHPFL